MVEGRTRTPSRAAPRPPRPRPPRPRLPAGVFQVRPGYYQAALVALYLGHLPLRALRADDLRGLYARLRAAPGADPIGRGLAPKTIREVNGTIRQALQQAVDDRILERNEAA